MDGSDEDWQVEYLDETSSSESSSSGDDDPISCVETAVSDEILEDYVLKYIFGEKASESQPPKKGNITTTNRTSGHGASVRKKSNGGRGGIRVRSNIYRDNVAIIEESDKPVPRRSKKNKSRMTTKQLQDSDDGDDACSQIDFTRWTGYETKQVLLAYKKFAADMIAANSYRQKRLVWDKIAAEVKMAPPRTCNAYIARMKIDNMKKTYLKQIEGRGRPHWRYFSLMKNVMETEKSLKNDAMLPVRRKFEFPVAEKDANVGNTPPLWFRQLAEASWRRHEERMKIKKRLCRVLESLAGK